MAERRRVVKWTLLILGGLYVAQIILFESLLVWGQPEYDNTMVITTFDAAGARRERVVARLEKDGVLYISVNHWPRGWFRRLDTSPAIRVNYKGTTAEYTAVPLHGDDYAAASASFPLPLSYRFMTGFPPRSIVRLEPGSD